jgi:hypothetical protein
MLRMLEYRVLRNVFGSKGRDKWRQEKTAQRGVL